jgi:hypothetical protein
MLDIYGHAPPGRNTPLIRGAEFLRIELAPLADGNVFVTLTATTVDEEEPQLLDQEVGRHRVTSIDEVLAIIRDQVRVMPAHPPTQPGD